MTRSPRAWARVAGVCWIVTIVAGVFAEFFVRAKLVVHMDAATTMHNIFANEALYRLGFAAEFTGTAAYLALSAILYRLLAPVNRTTSLIAMLFSIVGCTIGMLNLVAHAAPLALAAGPSPSAAFGAEQWQALAFAFLELREKALTVALMCFGVQCFLVGWLIIRSTFLPKILGLFLLIGGAGYLASGYAAVVLPPLSAQIGAFGFLPGMAAEALIALWLTLVGLNVAKWTMQKTEMIPDRLSERPAELR